MEKELVEEYFSSSFSRSQKDNNERIKEKPVETYLGNN